MSRLADEAMYFGAVADGVESQQGKIADLRQQLAAKDAEIERIKADKEGLVCGDCDGSGWLENRVDGRYPCTCMTEAEPYQILQEQLEAAQAEINEQARIVGMGGEREIALRQKLDIVSSLLREAAGRMSYGHWSTEFRARVETALKTKEPKP